MATERDLPEMELFEKIAMREEVKQELADQHGPIREALKDVRYKIAILSGKGGVGKTSAVVNMASVLKEMGYSVGILDADVHGPSVPKMLGLDKRDSHGAGKHDMKGICQRAEMEAMQQEAMKHHGPEMKHDHHMASAPNEMDHMHGAWGMNPAVTDNGVKVMSVSLFWPGEATPVMWKGHFKARVIRQLLASVKWGKMDFLLVDLPPGTGDEPTTIMKSIPGLDGMVLVTSPQEVSVAVCSKAISSANELGASLFGLIENMSDFCCPHCGKEIAILGQGKGEDLARTYQIPFLGRIPLNEFAGKAADEGVPVVVRYPDSPVSKAFRVITNELLKIFNEGGEKILRILITGGAGNIGRELVRRSLAAGNEVTVFDIPQAKYEGLEGEKGITVVKGFVTDVATMATAVKGVDSVIHLAALMTHLSTDREKTMSVNVGGTKTVLDALVKEGRDVQVTFSSSVSTYGWTVKDAPPIKIDHSQVGMDLYAESKIEAEKVVFASGIPYTVLRITGVVIPTFYDPNPWQFLKDQRVEFVARDDVAAALYNSSVTKEARNKIFNVAGGKAWQMLATNGQRNTWR